MKSVVSQYQPYLCIIYDICIYVKTLLPAYVQTCNSLEVITNINSDNGQRLVFLWQETGSIHF